MMLSLYRKCHELQLIKACNLDENLIINDADDDDDDDNDEDNDNDNDDNDDYDDDDESCDLRLEFWIVKTS